MEHVEDWLGPSEEAPNCTFYIYALVLHWHASPIPNESIRKAIKQLTDEVFRFGQQTEHHEQLLLDGQQAMETYVKELKSKQEQVVTQSRDQDQ